jgi:hypothetical protein
MSKAADCLAPTGDGANVTTVVAFDLTTTARRVALPRGFYGEFIFVQAIGANAYWFLTKSNSAVVDRTVSPTAAGATSVSLGSYLANGASRQVQCPNANADETVYVCWQGDAAGTLFEVSKASGRPFVSAFS